ncbi:Protein-glutamate methylesterase/protein-glutamine glutaminase [Gammaproteobacteria bacterium]|nr:Protein-glutamate methylesterase/protein-glutamine glutaminase [Gammaproteobacteria bacterium]
MAIRVLIIDDSPVMRLLLREIIDGAPDMKVAGTAADPIEARELIKALEPDVLTLDVEMPKMNGVEFLRRLMKLRPMPVVMISTLTEQGSQTTLEALELGAVDFVPKPAGHSLEALKQSAEEIRDKIRGAHGARVRTLRAEAPPSAPPASSALAAPRFDPRRLVAIGASTGGTEAIKEVLTRFPAEMPGIVIVQHMPETFTGSFARRLDGLCRIRVKEAGDGERILPGTAYLAPGHSHLSVRKSGGLYVAELSRGEPVNRHRPSVDVLFDSVAAVAAQHAVGVILTGMGKDGARGLLAMHRVGAWNIAQDQASCIVYGMPREAVAIGAADEVLPLPDIAGRVVARLASERPALRSSRA